MKPSEVYKLLRAIAANPDSRFMGKPDHMQALINDGLVVEHDGIITADEHPGVAYKYRITPKGVEWMENYKRQKLLRVFEWVKTGWGAIAAIITVAAAALGIVATIRSLFY